MRTLLVTNKYTLLENASGSVIALTKFYQITPVIINELISEIITILTQLGYCVNVVPIISINNGVFEFTFDCLP